MDQQKVAGRGQRDTWLQEVYSEEGYKENYYFLMRRVTTELPVPVGDAVAIRVTWPIARRAEIRNNILYGLL